MLALLGRVLYRGAPLAPMHRSYSTRTIASYYSEILMRALEPRAYVHMYFVANETRMGFARSIFGYGTSKWDVVASLSSEKILEINDSAFDV